VVVAAPGGHEGAVRLEAVDLAAARVGGVEEALAVEGQEARPGAEGRGQFRRALASELARPVAALAQAGQELPLRAELLDATVAVVSDVDRAVRTHRWPRRKPELAVAPARLAPLAQHFALRGAGDDAVLAEGQ